MNPQQPHSYHPYARPLANLPNNAGPTPWMQFPVARTGQELQGLREANFNLWQQVNVLASELRRVQALNKKLDFQQNQFLDLQSNLQLSNAYCAFMQNEYHKEVQAKEQVMKEFEEYRKQCDAPPVLSSNPYMKVKREVETRPSSPSFAADSGFEDTVGDMDPTTSQASESMDAGQMYSTMSMEHVPQVGMEETVAPAEITPVDWSVLDGPPKNFASMEAVSMNPMMSTEQVPQVAMQETDAHQTKRTLVDWSTVTQGTVQMGAGPMVETTPVDWSVLGAAPQNTVSMDVNKNTTVNWNTVTQNNAEPMFPIIPMEKVPQAAIEETVSQMRTTVDWNTLNQNIPFLPMDQVPPVGMEVTVFSTVSSPTVTQAPQDTVSAMRSTPPTVPPATTIFPNPLPMMMYPPLMPFPATPFAAACRFYHNTYAHLGEYQQYDLTAILFNPNGEKVLPQIVDRIYNTHAFYESQKKQGDTQAMWRLMSKEKKAQLKLIMEKIRGIQNQQMLDGLIKYRRPSETSPFWRLAEGYNLRRGLKTTGYV